MIVTRSDSSTLFDLVEEPRDQRKELRLKAAATGTNPHACGPWCEDEFGNRVRFIHSIGD
jgi:hypothetical protein